MQNFGKIKEIYNTILSESIITKSAGPRKLFKSYIKALKENKSLKTQFLVYNNIESKIEENEFKISEFIKSNISLMEGYDKSKLKKLNKGLFKGLPKGSVADISDVKKELYENISTLIFTKMAPNTIDKIVDATANIAEYIKSNEPKVIYEGYTDLPLSLTTAMYVDKFNAKYEDLDETTIKLVKTILESNEEGRKDIFSDLHKECVGLVNGKLSEGEEKEKLLAVKEKLLDMSYITETHMEDISNLIDLKETLKE